MLTMQEQSVLPSRGGHERRTGRASEAVGIIPRSERTCRWSATPRCRVRHLRSPPSPWRHLPSPPRWGLTGSMSILSGFGKQVSGDQYHPEPPSGCPKYQDLRHGCSGAEEDKTEQYLLVPFPLARGLGRT